MASRAVIPGSKVQGRFLTGLRGYERRDVRVGWIFGIAAFLLVSGVAMHFLLGGMLNALRKQSPVTDRWQTGNRPKAGEAGASFPRLQVSPPVDLDAFRKREDQELNSYGWVDGKAGVVRIPIQRAMELLLEKGLSVRAGTNGSRVGASSYDLLLQRSSQDQPGKK